MSRRRLLTICLFLAFCPSASADILQAGAAKLELVPPRLVPLAGYSRRDGKPASAIHDPPMVRALVLRQGDRRVALVSCDLLIIDEELFRAVQRRLRESDSNTSMTLLIAATHTHSGPGAYGRKYFEKISMGHFDPIVFDFLSSQIAEAIRQAAAHLQPVTIATASATTTGLVTNRMIPGGPIDDTLRIVVVSVSGQPAPLAVIANFSAHPTTLGAWNMELSADYPGILSRAIEERFPASVGLFFAGAVGDQAPVKEGNGFARAERIGRPLAEQAVALMATARPASSVDLSARQEVMRLPPARLRWGRLTFPTWFSQPFVDDDAMLTLVAIGPVLLLGVPCDLSVELGAQLHQHARARGNESLIIGFADDYIGYCIPPALYETGQYEAMMAFNGPDAGALIVQELQRLMDEVTEGRMQPAPAGGLHGGPGKAEGGTR